MSGVLVREDSHFVLSPYREQVDRSGEKDTVLQTLASLAREHGRFVKFFYQPDKTIEAVFSNSQGYLLGETVWRHFHKPEQLIYCECVASDQYLLVLVKDGVVFTDTIVNEKELIEELELAVTNHSQFEGHYFAKDELLLNLEKSLSSTKTNFSSLEKSGQSAVSTAMMAQDMLLLPFEQACRESFREPKQVTYGVVVGLVMLFIWSLVSFYKTDSEALVNSVVIEESGAGLHPVVSPPTGQLNDKHYLLTVAASMQLLYGLPGWELYRVHEVRSQPVFELRSIGGTMAELRSHLPQGWRVKKIHGDHVTLRLRQRLQHQASAGTISGSQLIEVFYMRLQKLLPVVNLVTDDRDVSLRVEAISPSILMLLSETFTDLAFELSSFDWQVKDGLLVGEIQFDRVRSGEKK